MASKDQDLLSTYAGGALYNAAMAGSIHFNPAEVTLDAAGPDINNMNSDALKTGMQTDYMAIEYDVRPIKNGWMYIDYDEPSIGIMMFIYTASNSGELAISDVQLISGESGSMNTDGLTAGTLSSHEISQMHESMAEYSTSTAAGLTGIALSMVGVPMPGMVGAALVDIATGNFSNLEMSVANGIKNTVTSQISGMVAKGVVGMLGVTNIAVAAGIMGLVSLGMTEAMEVATGMDNHYGFGGEFIGYNADGTRAYADKQSIAEGMSDLFGELAESAFGWATGYTHISDKEWQTAELAWQNSQRESQEYDDMSYDMSNDLTWGNFREIERAVDFNSWDIDGNSVNDNYEDAVARDLYGYNYGVGRPSQQKQDYDERRAEYNKTYGEGSNDNSTAEGYANSFGPTSNDEASVDADAD